jgi:hypothetical protein
VIASGLDSARGVFWAVLRRGGLRLRERGLLQIDRTATSEQCTDSASDQRRARVVSQAGPILLHHQ